MGGYTNFNGLTPLQRQQMYTLERANLIAARTMSMQRYLNVVRTQNQGIVHGGDDTDMHTLVQRNLKGFLQLKHCAAAVVENGCKHKPCSTCTRRSLKLLAVHSCPCMAPAQGWQSLQIWLGFFTFVIQVSCKMHGFIGGPVDQAKRSVLHPVVSQM